MEQILAQICADLSTKATLINDPEQLLCKQRFLTGDFGIDVNKSCQFSGICRWTLLVHNFREKIKSRLGKRVFGLDLFNKLSGTFQVSQLLRVSTEQLLFGIC